MSNSGVDTNMISKAQQVMSRFGSMAPAPNTFRFASDAQIRENENSAFPVQLGSTDPDDAKWHLREQVMSAQGNAAGVVDGVGQVIADEKFFDYANRKQQQQILYDFYKFMFAQADLSKPESANWWFQKFPWMRDMRLKEIDKQADFQKTLARIQVTGPESEDDFMLLFMIRNGTISIPEYSLNQMGALRPAGAGGTIATTFKEGFFSKMVTAPFWNSPWALPAPENQAQKVIWGRPVPTTATNQRMAADRTDQAGGWLAAPGWGGLMPPAAERPFIAAGANAALNPAQPAIPAKRMGWKNIFGQ